jgi:hypothetical protein
MNKTASGFIMSLVLNPPTIPLGSNTLLQGAVQNTGSQSISVTARFTDNFNGTATTISQSNFSVPAGQTVPIVASYLPGVAGIHTIVFTVTIKKGKRPTTTQLEAQLTVVAPVVSSGANTSRTNYLEPALTGALDLTQSGRGAGYSFNEPTLSPAVFTRVTDQNTDTLRLGDSYTAPDSAETRAINIDSTMFYLLNANSGGLYPFTWDGVTPTRIGTGNGGGLLLPLTGGSALPSWSGQNAKIMWGTSGFKLRKLDFTTVTGSSTSIPYTEPLDYDTVYNAITGGHLTVNVDYMCSLGVSGVDAANDFIATGISGAQDTWKYAVWYNTSSGRYKVLDVNSNPMRVWDSASPGWVNNAFAGGYTMHNVKLAQDGRYVLITPTGSRQIFWDTTTDTIAQSSVQLDGGHRSAGYGYVINQYANGSDATQWILRPLSDITSATNLVDPTLSDPSSVPQYVALNPDFDEHSSWHNARVATLNPVFSSTSRTTTIDTLHPWRPYDNEIVAIGTDTVRVVYRIAHHHSRNVSGGARAVGYYDNAFGQVSADGRYFLVGSNWGLTLQYSSGVDPNTGAPCSPCYRIDAFMVTLPTGLGQ